MDGLAEFYNEFQWFFSLGYVTIISTVVTILLLQLFKVTFLKKFLSEATSTQKDSVLSMTGTITSLVVYVIIHFANEMIIQRTFFIDFNAVIQSTQLISGAAVTWAAAKGIYTVAHKFIQRLKAKKASTAKGESESVEEVVDVAEEEIKKSESAAQTSQVAPIGSKSDHTKLKKVSSTSTKKLL